MGPPGTPRQHGEVSCQPSSLTPAPPRPPCWRTAPSILPHCCLLGPSQALVRPARGWWGLQRGAASHWVVKQGGGETSQTADHRKLPSSKRKFQSPPQHNSEPTFQSKWVLGRCSLARCLCGLMISQPGQRGAGGTVAEDRIRSCATRVRSQPASRTGQWHSHALIQQPHPKRCTPGIITQRPASTDDRLHDALITVTRK